MDAGLPPALDMLARRVRVGESTWMVLPAAATLEVATLAIQAAAKRRRQGTNMDHDLEGRLTAVVRRLESIEA